MGINERLSKMDAVMFNRIAELRLRVEELEWLWGKNSRPSTKDVLEHAWVIQRSICVMIEFLEELDRLANKAKAVAEHTPKGESHVG
jgi:hypothetical protein